MAQNKPKISVVTTCKNGARFLRETVESILNQSFTDYEHVLVDGGSTDETLKILSEYKDIRWISEPDEDANEGFHKAIAMTRGEYLMFCCISDGYLSKNWFQQCVDVLDSDPEVSLVYGLPQYMTEDGSLERISDSEFFNQPPPQKMEFLPFWLATFFLYPEITYCVRSEVFKKCFPKRNSLDFLDRQNPFVKFVYNFNVMGYLPYFLPVVASFGRIHHDSRNNTMKEIGEKTIRQYSLDVVRYRNDVLCGKTKHVFHNGASNVIKVIKPYELKFYRQKVLKYRMTRKIYFDRPDPINLHFWSRKFKRLLGKLPFFWRFALP